MALQSNAAEGVAAFVHPAQVSAPTVVSGMIQKASVMFRTLPRTAILAVVLVALASPGVAYAQHHHGGPHHSAVFVGGYFYNPFFGPYPWWPSYAYPYVYYPVYDTRAELRLLVTPKEANVYIDGFYSGVVDDFDGFFQRLPVPPGAHEVVLYLQGYRTVHQTVYATSGPTYKLTYTMEHLGAGETSEPPPVAPPVPEPPPGSATLPRTPRPGGQPAVDVTPPRAPQPSAQDSTFGALVIRVQPGEAEISIDGERWQSSAPADRLAIQVGEGPHRIVIQKTGYGTFSADIVVRRGETTPAQCQPLAGVASMSRIAILLSLFVAGSSAALAQEAPAPLPASQGPMVVERVRDGFAGAPEFKVTQIDSTTGNFVGGYGGWLIDNTLLIGGGAYWLTNGAGIHDMGYGGAVVEWLQRVNRPIGFSVRGLIGFGVATLTDNFPIATRGFDGGNRFSPGRPGPPTTSVVQVRYSDGFFVAEPQANFLINVNPKMRVSVGGGYRLVGGAYRADDRLRGATGSVSVQFGGSSSRKLP